MRLYTGNRSNETGSFIKIRHLRLLAGLGLGLVIMTVLMTAMNPAESQDYRLALSQTMVQEGMDSKIDTRAVTSRILEQKFQVHMQESDQGVGAIPNVEVWVLNDPFYPLMGNVGTLRKSDGILASKEWQMLGFPTYEETSSGGSTSSSSTTSTTSSSTTSNVTSSATAGSPQKVVMVQEIYEVRGIRYARIKVNDSSYDRLKSGSDFAETLRVQEIKDSQTVVLICGDESYELKVGELRKI